MQGSPETDRSRRLLVFNCHEAWVYQLSVLPLGLDIVVGLEGRYKPNWDKQMRPVPPNGRLVRLPEVLARHEPYHCIVAHNITDLLDVRQFPGPRLLVLHSTLEGRTAQEASRIPPDRMRAMAADYLSLVGGHAVAVSPMKARSWGLTDDVVISSVDINGYPPFTGELAAGFRAANHVGKRKNVLLWDFHARAFDGIPLRLVGHNPDMPGVDAPRDWDDLKRAFQTHRFYVHTADPRYEDGYNMSVMEAMAAGMPVLGNAHPTSPVEHGVNGYVTEEPEALRAFACKLLSDRELAACLGASARRTAEERYSAERFREGFMAAITTARRKWASRKVTF
jgi:hypothetical protein